jgi:hypothetical protein
MIFSTGTGAISSQRWRLIGVGAARAACPSAFVAVEESRAYPTSSQHASPASPTRALPPAAWRAASACWDGPSPGGGQQTFSRPP